MRKKTIVFFLLILFTASFSCCQKKVLNTAQATQPARVNSLSISTVTTPVAINLNGAVITFDGLTNPDSLPYNEKDFAVERLQDISRNFNVTIKFNSIFAKKKDAAAEIITSAKAGAPLLDVALVSRKDYEILAENGVLENITNTVLSYGFPESYFSGSWYNGRLMGFSTRPSFPAKIIVFNRTLLNELGIKTDPGQMLLEGKWSWTDFYNYCLTIKEKMPSNSIVIGGLPESWLYCLAAANGSMAVNPVTNVLMYDSEGFTNTIEFIQKLAASNMIDISGTISSNDFKNSFIDGKIPIYIADIQELPLFSEDGLNYGVTAFPWGFGIKLNSNFQYLDDMLLGNYMAIAEEPLLFVLIKGENNSGALSKAPAKTYLDMVYSYNQEDALYLAINKQREKSGLGIVLTSDKTAIREKLLTENDKNIFEWFMSTPVVLNALDILSAGNALSFPSVFNDLIKTGELNDVLPDVLIKDSTTLAKNGNIKLKHLNSSLRAEVEKFLPPFVD